MGATFADWATPSAKDSMRLSELITVLQRLEQVADMEVRIDKMEDDLGPAEIGCIFIETWKTVQPYVVIDSATPQEASDHYEIEPLWPSKKEASGEQP